MSCLLVTFCVVTAVLASHNTTEAMKREVGFSFVLSNFQEHKNNMIHCQAPITLDCWI